MRILLADDATLLREGLAGLLTTAECEVMIQMTGAGTLHTEVGRLVAVEELPDVVVTDVRMPPTDTDDELRAMIDLCRTYPGLPVMVLNAYVAGPRVQDLLEETESPTSPAEPEVPGASSGGAVGYLLKEYMGRVADFLHSLDIVVDGGIVIGPEVVSHLVKTARATGSTRETAQMVIGRRTGEDVGTMVGAGLGAAPTTSGTREPVPAAAALSSTPSGGIVNAAPGGAGPDRLTWCEQEVLELMAQGPSNAQIAERLVISDGTVAKHAANTLRGLGLQPGEKNRRVRTVLAWLHARA